MNKKNKAKYLSFYKIYQDNFLIDQVTIKCHNLRQHGEPEICHVLALKALSRSKKS